MAQAPPVLITAFSRHDTLREVFLALRLAKPPRLYFACDGPRNEQERAKCEKVRSLVGLVDWKCEVNTLFHEHNLGCRAAMVANIDWFFSKEEEGIILEDDIVPDPTFFRFCRELLSEYRSDPRVWAIIGNNLSAPDVPRKPDTYWLSRHGYGAYWGWASWRRSWKLFDADMKEWPSVRGTVDFDRAFLSTAERKEAYALFDGTHSGLIPTAWDYQFDFAKMLAGAANIIPEANLCLNIGFSGDGTHTVNAKDNRNKGKLQKATFPLRPPDSLEIDPGRNLAYFNAYVLPSRFARIKNIIKGLLPSSLERKLTPVLSNVQRKLGL